MHARTLNSTKGIHFVPLRLDEVRQYLSSRFPRLDHNTVLNAVRFDPMIVDFDASTGRVYDEENALITDLYVARPLTYLTLEKEDPTFRNPNILRIFSFTRGLDAERGIVPSSLIVDIIKAKFGFRPEFKEKGTSDLTTILGWQAKGLWRAGVQLFLTDNIDRETIDRGIEFADRFAALVSTISVADIWRLKSKIGGIADNDLAAIMTNLHARIFENEVADYLRRQHSYAQPINRYTPPYLGRQLDVYATSRIVGGTTRVTVCECKLTLDERTIGREEVLAFKKLAWIVRAKEVEYVQGTGGRLKFSAWFVTNSRNLSETRGIIDEEFRIMVARLPKNWIRMDNWKIASLQAEPK